MITVPGDLTRLVFIHRGKQLQRMIPGATVTQTWCAVHMDRTDHLYTGSKLICLECHPEMRPGETELDGE